MHELCRRRWTAAGHRVRERAAPGLQFPHHGLSVADQVRRWPTATCTAPPLDASHRMPRQGGNGGGRGGWRGSWPKTTCTHLTRARPLACLLWRRRRRSLPDAPTDADFTPAPSTSSPPEAQRGKFQQFMAAQHGMNGQHMQQFDALMQHKQQPAPAQRRQQQQQLPPQHQAWERSYPHRLLAVTCHNGSAFIYHAWSGDRVHQLELPQGGRGRRRRLAVCVWGGGGGARLGHADLCASSRRPGKEHSLLLGGRARPARRLPPLLLGSWPPPALLQAWHPRAASSRGVAGPGTASTCCWSSSWSRRGGTRPPG